MDRSYDEAQDRRREIYYRRKYGEAERMAIFEQAAMEIDFAERMLLDGSTSDEIVPLTLAMRHNGDPGIVITEADEGQARSSVEIAWMKIKGRRGFRKDSA